MGFIMPIEIIHIIIPGAPPDWRRGAHHNHNNTHNTIII